MKHNRILLRLRCSVASMKESGIDVDKLAIVRELAERGSITAVAAATYRTPSAVSQTIKALERDLGTVLVEREGRGVRLTDAGRP